MADQKELNRDKRSLNGFIDNLDTELHLNGYRFCGPGTKLDERLAKGEHGINKLDEACRYHDIAYKYLRDDSSRREADMELAKSAVRRLLDVTVGKREAKWAYLVALGMMYKNIERPAHETSKNIPLLDALDLFTDYIHSTGQLGNLIADMKSAEDKLEELKTQHTGILSIED